MTRADFPFEQVLNARGFYRLANRSGWINADGAFIDGLEAAACRDNSDMRCLIDHAVDDAKPHVDITAGAGLTFGEDLPKCPEEIKWNGIGLLQGQRAYFGANERGQLIQRVTPEALLHGIVHGDDRCTFTKTDAVIRFQMELHGWIHSRPDGPRYGKCSACKRAYERFDSPEQVEAFTQAMVDEACAPKKDDSAWRTFYGLPPGPGAYSTATSKPLEVPSVNDLLKTMRLIQSPYVEPGKMYLVGADFGRAFSSGCLVGIQPKPPSRLRRLVRWAFRREPKPFLLHNPETDFA